MTQEEKELLLKDLSSRLPYGVVYHRNDGANIKLNAIDVERGLLNYTDDIEERECKPYLRPMSSMTEEERKEYKHLIAFSGSPDGAANLVDWLNKKMKMFAYRTINSLIVMTKKESEKKRQDTLRKMRTYGLHASEVDILEECGEL